MFLKLIDVFRFFTEIELDETQRLYELICVSIVCLILLVVLIVLIIKNNRKYKNSGKGKKQNGSYKKSGY